jgi:hypothetical protein
MRARRAGVKCGFGRGSPTTALISVSKEEVRVGAHGGEVALDL